MPRLADHPTRIRPLGGRPGALVMVDKHPICDACVTSPDEWRTGRDLLIEYRARPSPMPPALSVLGGLAPIVECGAGTGYWAALLRARESTWSRMT